MRPQFGIAAVQRAAHELVLGHAARRPAGLLVGAGARTPRSAPRGGRPRRRAPWPARAPGRRRSARRRRSRPRPRRRCTPAAPPASAKRLSDVDSLPSTVMRLKLAAAASASSSRSSPAGTSASVVTTAIIVPRSGRIIAAPFAIAPSRTSPPASSSVRWATLGEASVVQMASAAAAPPSGASARGGRRGCRPRRAPSAAARRSRPSRRPAPRAARRRRARPRARSCARASARPCAPVAALALPLETTIARARPRVALERRAARAHRRAGRPRCA